VVDRTALEMRHTGNRIGGSNPSLSANRKHRLGRLPGAAAIVADLDRAIVDQSFIGLPISIRHGQVGALCPAHIAIPLTGC
jgi:hypothetical protein